MEERCDRSYEAAARSPVVLHLGFAGQGANDKPKAMDRHGYEMWRLVAQDFERKQAARFAGILQFPSSLPMEMTDFMESSER